MTRHHYIASGCHANRALYHFGRDLISNLCLCVCAPGSGRHGQREVLPGRSAGVQRELVKIRTGSTVLRGAQPGCLSD